MTIRARLWTAIAVTVAGLALTAGVAIWAMAELADKFDHVQRAADAQALALQLKFGVTDFNGWQTAYGYDDGRSRPIFLRSVASFRETLAEAQRGLAGAEERRLVDRVAAAFADFMRLDDEAFAALKAGRRDEVRRLFLGPEIEHFQRAAAAAQELATYEAAHAQSEQRSFRSARRDALRFVIVAALIAGLLVVLLLVTANDLARRAERALARAGEGGPP